MKKANKRFLIKLIILSLITFYNCGKDPEVNQNVIRPLVRLSTEDIPALEDAIQVKYGEIPWGHSNFIDNYVAKFEFRWETDDYIYIEEYITENKELANEYLLEMHQYYTNPFIEEQKDQPAVVGDLSYSQGREFIRDNIIIKIHASGELEEKLTEIAKQVDDKILKNITFTSIDQVKPLINKFEITQNPVKELSETRLNIDIYDPNNLNVVFNWRFDPGTGHGGIRKDDLGNYFYTSSYPNTEISEVELTLIVTNEYGFCSDSTIYIQIEPE